MAYHRSRSLGVGAKIIRRRKSLTSICHCSKDRSISLTLIIYPPNTQLLHSLAQFLHKFIPFFCVFHLGFGLGTPGSGKSTLLTQHLRRSDARLIKYYAYVPGTAGPRTTRGESVNFLHDVVLQLENAGFCSGHSPSRFDHNQLLERFHEQLQLLNRDWQETGCKTIILVDGLDHIEREQHPGRSLLVDLPEPDQIPDGVYLVLGSQTDTPLSGRIKTEIRHQARRIEMLPLGRQQVHEIIAAADIPILVAPEQKDRVYALSNGHPLYLNYLINRMRSCEEAEQLEGVLQGKHAL